MLQVTPQFGSYLRHRPAAVLRMPHKALRHHLVRCVTRPTHGSSLPANAASSAPPTHATLKARSSSPPSKEDKIRRDPAVATDRQRS